MVVSYSLLVFTPYVYLAILKSWLLVVGFYYLCLSSYSQIHAVHPNQLLTINHQQKSRMRTTIDALFMSLLKQKLP